MERQSKKETDTEQTRVLGIKGALKISGVPCLLLGFLCYCAAEHTTMLWASSYQVEAKGIGKEQAAAFGSLFFIGITAGRFLSGIVSEKIGDRNMIRIGTAVIVCGALLVLLPFASTLPALIGLVVIGFGCAPIYPSIIHSTPAHFGAENSQAIIGIQMASAYIGSTFMPPLFGLLTNHISFRLFPFYILIIFCLMLVLVEMTYRKTARQR